MSFLIFYENVDLEPDVSTVDSISLSGDFIFNQRQNISIYNGVIGISAKISIVEGQINSEGVRFYLSMIGGGWWILGNVTHHLNNTYEMSFNSTDFGEGIHQVRVNFTDTLKQTWAATTRPFVIDNVEDIPLVRMMDPKPGDEISENVTFMAEIADPENNIFTFGFYYRNDTINWTMINITDRWPNRNFYIAILNTNVVMNGNLSVKVEATDRNLYMGIDEIKVIVSNGD